MVQRLLTIAAAAVLVIPMTLTSARAEVIYKDQGLYEKQRWNIAPRYDNLDNPSDAPGIVTSGQDPADPSGPALDMRVPSGPPGDVSETGDPLGD